MVGKFKDSEMEDVDWGDAYHFEGRYIYVNFMRLTEALLSIDGFFYPISVVCLGILPTYTQLVVIPAEVVVKYLRVTNSLSHM